MIVLFVLMVAAVLPLVLAWRKTSSICIEVKEKEESPCADCLRWSECNGVDKQCPLLQEG